MPLDVGIQKENGHKQWRRNAREKFGTLFEKIIGEMNEFA